MRHFHLSMQGSLPKGLKYITLQNMGVGWILLRSSFPLSVVSALRTTGYPICPRSEHCLYHGLRQGINCRKALTGISLPMMPELSSNICILLLRFKVYRVLVTLLSNISLLHPNSSCFPLIDFISP